LSDDGRIGIRIWEAQKLMDPQIHNTVCQTPPFFLNLNSILSLTIRIYFFLPAGAAPGAEVLDGFLGSFDEDSAKH
jgi:hypothetical protein